MNNFEWGGGEKKTRESENESNNDAGFNIPIDDPKRDQRLKEQARFGDPMAGLLGSESNFDNSSGKKKRSSKKNQSVQISLEYSGPGVVSNRFGIKPGAAWDGRDRSNGWEAKCFAKLNAVGVSQQSKFAYSVNDL